MSAVVVYGAVVFGVFVCLQAEDGIRYLVRSRGLGDVYKRQAVVRGIGQDSGLLEALALDRFVGDHRRLDRVVRRRAENIVGLVVRGLELGGDHLSLIHI